MQMNHSDCYWKGCFSISTATKTTRSQTASMRLTLSRASRKRQRPLPQRMAFRIASMAFPRAVPISAVRCRTRMSLRMRSPCPRLCLCERKTWRVRGIASFILRKGWGLIIQFTDAKATFQSISSIYVYSLQPTVLQDLNVLTDVAGEMFAKHAQEDPLEYGKTWGMIQGNNVRVRHALGFLYSSDTNSICAAETNRRSPSCTSSRSGSSSP